MQRWSTVWIRDLARVIEALEKRKMMDNTLILFIADNGGCAEGMGRKEGIQYKDGSRGSQAHESD